MTVRELIALLQEQDMEALVVVTEPDWGCRCACEDEWEVHKIYPGHITYGTALPKPTTYDAVKLGF